MMLSAPLPYWWRIQLISVQLCRLISNISRELFRQSNFWLFKMNLPPLALILGILSNTVLPHAFQLKWHSFHFFMIALVRAVISFLLLMQSFPRIFWNLFPTHHRELFLEPFYVSISLFVLVLSILIVFSLIAPWNKARKCKQNNCNHRDSKQSSMQYRISIFC